MTLLQYQTQSRQKLWRTEQYPTHVVKVMSHQMISVSQWLSPVALLMQTINRGDGMIPVFMGYSTVPQVFMALNLEWLIIVHYKFFLIQVFINDLYWIPQCTSRVRYDSCGVLGNRQLSLLKTGEDNSTLEQKVKKYLNPLIWSNNRGF